MSHYWTAEDDPAIRKLQARDWVEDLTEFSPDVVEEACRDWRHAHKTRPTIYDIRVLAIAEVERRKALQAAALPPPANEPWRYADERRRCQNTWKSCAHRWQTRGFICRAECREHIPDYRELTDDEAIRTRGAEAKWQTKEMG